MTSRNPISRFSKSPLLQHKQHAISITPPREWHSKHDTKPPVGEHTPSRPSSAKIRTQAERCDVLQQDLESNKQSIVHFSITVLETNEEYKQLCGKFGKKEDWHRIVGLSMLVNDIQRQFTELERKLNHYNAENNKLKKITNELERRLKQLDGRRIFIANKRKSMKEQLSASPKNLPKRPKVTMSPSSSQLRATDSQLNRSVESVRAEKSDIQVQLSKCQSELDDLIRTERRLKESINGLQDLHNDIKHGILMLKKKETTFRSNKKHKQDVRKTATKQVHTLQPSQSTNNLEALQPSQSTNNLEAMKNEAKAFQEREILRAQLEIQQKERGSESLEKRIVELQNQLNYANKKFGKLQEQLMQTTEQQFEDKWIGHYNEKDERIAELEKSIRDEAINHQMLLQQKKHQISELELKLKKSSQELTKANEDIKSLQTAVTTKLTQELAKANEDIKSLQTAVSTKQSELEICRTRLKESSQEVAKANEDIKSLQIAVSTKQSDLEICHLRLKESSQELTEANEDIKSLQIAVSTKQSELEICHISLNEKSTELVTAKYKEADLIHQAEELKHQVEELKNTRKNLNEKSMELVTAKEEFTFKEAGLICRVEELKQQNKELKNTRKKHEKFTTPLSKQDDQSFKNYENIPKRLLIEQLSKTEQELKKYQERLKESSQEVAKANEDIKSLQAVVSTKQSELEIFHTRLKESSQEVAKANEDIKSLQIAVSTKQSDLEICHLRLKESSQEVAKANEDIKSLQIAVSTKQSDLEVCHISLNEKSTELVTAKYKEADLIRQVEELKHQVEELKNTCKSLNEKSTELVTAKEEFTFKEAGLIRQVEELQQQNEELKNTRKKLKKVLEEKDLELAETKESYQTAMAQKNEGFQRRREKSTSPSSKQDDQSFKNYENIPKRLLIEQLSKTEQELKKYQESLLKYEEKSFKYTNAFTSAGEGSVLEMSKRYRHLQHNKRAAAARALKKVHKIDVRDHLCDHIMSAYETARSVVLDEARKCIKNNLFELQTNDESDNELLQGCMVILSCVQEDERIKNVAINQINTTLDQLYKKLMGNKPLPSEVEDYYQSLAELAWCAVARPIPMIIAKSPDTYCKSYHELKDGEDVEDGCPVSYVYPVLYSSNEWPRQVAQQGRVVLKQHL